MFLLVLVLLYVLSISIISPMVIHGLMLAAQEQLAPDQAKSTTSCKMLFPTVGYTESLEVTPTTGTNGKKTS